MPPTLCSPLSLGLTLLTRNVASYPLWLGPSEVFALVSTPCLRPHADLGWARTGELALERSWRRCKAQPAVPAYKALGDYRRCWQLALGFPRPWESAPLPPTPPRPWARRTALLELALDFIRREQSKHSIT